MQKFVCITTFTMIIVIIPASFCDSHFLKVLWLKEDLQKHAKCGKRLHKMWNFFVKVISECICFMLNVSTNICHLVEDADNNNIQPRRNVAFK